VRDEKDSMAHNGDSMIYLASIGAAAIVAAIVWGLFAVVDFIVKVNLIEEQLMALRKAFWEHEDSEMSKQTRASLRFNMDDKLKS